MRTNDFLQKHVFLGISVNCVESSIWIGGFEKLGRQALA